MKPFSRQLNTELLTIFIVYFSTFSLKDNSIVAAGENQMTEVIKHTRDVDLSCVNAGTFQETAP